RLQLVERREAVARVCVAELVDEPGVAVEGAHVRPQSPREENRADREVLPGGSRRYLAHLHVRTAYEPRLRTHRGGCLNAPARRGGAARLPPRKGASRGRGQRTGSGRNDGDPR